MKTRWEYVAGTARPFQVVEVCNEQGRMGWELCGTYQSEAPANLSSNWPASVELIFKRPTKRGEPPTNKQ